MKITLLFVITNKEKRFRFGFKIIYHGLVLRLKLQLHSKLKCVMKVNEQYKKSRLN